MFGHIWGCFLVSAMIRDCLFLRPPWCFLKQHRVQVQGAAGSMACTLPPASWASLPPGSCTLPLKMQVPKHFPDGFPSLRLPHAPAHQEPRAWARILGSLIPSRTHTSPHLHPTPQTCLIITDFSCRFVLVSAVFRKLDSLEA